MKYDIIVPALIAFGVSVILSPIIIPFLKKLKFGQFVRDDGPESHLKKSGTPTMGGLIILFSIVITSLFYIKDHKEIVPILFATLGFGLVGFLDDFIKVVMKRSLGLRAWQKMLGQFLVTGVFAYYIHAYTDLGTTMIIPFTHKVVDLGWVYFPLMFFVMLGTANGANFTDGLDGLASSVTVLIATFFAIASIAAGSGVTPITCAVVGSLLGFLVYNVYPARVLQMPLIILIVAFIYLAEVLSVIIQVVSFKTTGKRVFKMAPIHHHFELCGWPETKVVAIFSIVTTILCLIGILAI